MTLFKNIEFRHNEPFPILHFSYIFPLSIFPQLHLWFQWFSVQWCLICCLTFPLRQWSCISSLEVPFVVLNLFFHAVLLFSYAFSFMKSGVFFTCGTLFWSRLKRFLSKMPVFASHRWIGHFASLNPFYTTYFIWEA